MIPQPNQPGTPMQRDCPLVIIRWEDSAQPIPAWRHLSQLPETRAIECATVGWLLKDDDDVKVLCQSVGDLDNALDALDKAYSLILKVNGDEDPEVLQQKEDLRFTISKRIIEVYSSRFTVANGQHKAIPLVMNQHVERALRSFKGRERQ